jgi:hypothetical protein
MAPPFLYKYQPLCAQSIQNLKAQVLYFGSPRHFNDPFDCALIPNFRTPTNDDLERLRQHYLSRNLPEDARKEFKGADLPTLQSLFLRAGKAAFEKAVRVFLETTGVCCFSEKYDDLLMWSHYGGQYKGFCLEFSPNDPEFKQKVQKVEYRDDIPCIDLVPIILSSPEEPDKQILDLFCTKSTSWRYEHEWRGLHDKGGTAFRYPAEWLTGVYFGPRMEIEWCEIICLILQTQNHRVNFFRGRRSEAEFKVAFEQVRYTPGAETNGE